MCQSNVLLRGSSIPEITAIRSWPFALDPAPYASKAICAKHVPCYRAKLSFHFEAAQRRFSALHCGLSQSDGQIAVYDLGRQFANRTGCCQAAVVEDTEFGGNPTGERELLLHQKHR